MATFYYNGIVDTDWVTLGNWWTDSGFSVAATSLPTITDDVEMWETADANTGGFIAVHDLAQKVGMLDVILTVTGLATFENDTSYGYGTLTGNATFNGNSTNPGTIVGNVTFNNTSSNGAGGETYGDAIFNDSSSNAGTVNDSLIAALTPTFGSPTATADGFTVQISNYDATYTWAGTATSSGSVAINGTGLVTVTGVASLTSSTATITTTRAGYVGGVAVVTETSEAASFSSTSVILSSTSNYTVPIGAKVIKIWSIGAGGSSTYSCDGGNGTAGNAGVAAYTHGFISNTNVVVNGSIGQPVASVCDLSTAGGSTTLSNLSTVISPSISSIVGGGGGAGGFVADRASSGNLSTHTLWTTNSTIRRDYVGVNAVITAAGGNATTHTYGKAGEPGSAGAIVMQFLPATDLVLPFTGSGSFTIPAGYSSVKIWAVGGGGIGTIYCDGGPDTNGGYGGIAYKTWSVSSGQVITYSAGAALSGSFCSSPTNGNASTATLNSITITGSAGLGNGTNGSGSGGDGSGVYGSDVSSIYAAYATYSPSTPTYGLRGVIANTAGLIGGIVLVKFMV